MVDMQKFEPSTFRPVAVVRSFFPKPIAAGSYRIGTATLIGPRIALTAGHVLFDANQGGYCIKCTLTFGGQLLRSANFWDVPVQYSKKDAFASEPAFSAFDYGCIGLPEAIDHDVPYMTPETAATSYLASTTLNLAGFRSSEFPAEGRWIFGAGFRGAEVDDVRFYYDVDTRAGTSGGPLYAVKNGQSYVHGVHTALFAEGASALRINENVLSMIREWEQLLRPK